MLKKRENIISGSHRQTKLFGKKIAQFLKSGDCILLYGDVGAGKTVLIKGIAEGLHIKQFVSSPSFTIINEYNGTMPMYHIDLYRISPSDVVFLGLEEYLWGKGISAVEWAERITGNIPEHVWKINIQKKSINTRFIAVERS